MPPSRGGAPASREGVSPPKGSRPSAFPPSRTASSGKTQALPSLSYVAPEVKKIGTLAGGILLILLLLSLLLPQGAIAQAAVLGGSILLVTLILLRQG